MFAKMQNKRKKRCFCIFISLKKQKIRLLVLLRRSIPSFRKLPYNEMLSWQKNTFFCLFICIIEKKAVTLQPILRAKLPSMLTRTLIIN